MKYYVELATWFKRYTGGIDRLEIAAARYDTVRGAVASHGVPEDEIGFITILNNDGSSRLIDDSFKPNEGDTFKVFPKIIGG